MKALGAALSVFFFMWIEGLELKSFDMVELFT